MPFEGEVTMSLDMYVYILEYVKHKHTDTRCGNNEQLIFKTTPYCFACFTSGIVCCSLRAK